MRVSLILRAGNKKGLFLNDLKKIMEAPQYLLKAKTDQQRIVFDKIKHLNKWYIKIIGLDEVKVYQERVTALQDQLLNTQAKRRELNIHLAEIRQKAREVQSQIQHVDRKEKFDAYCHLINDERTILNMERTVSATFQEYDQAERELFTASTNADRDSQEKQRLQLEYSKYISVIFSLLGSFLAFVYTFIWKHDLKKHIHREVSTIKPIIQQEMMKKTEGQGLGGYVRGFGGYVRGFGGYASGVVGYVSGLGGYVSRVGGYVSGLGGYVSGIGGYISKLGGYVRGFGGYVSGVGGYVAAPARYVVAHVRYVAGILGFGKKD